jgi:exosortase/archaeosortase family protein
VVWAGSYAFLRKARAWLLAYLVGAVGFSLLAIYAFRGSRFEALVERTSAVGTHLLAGVFGIPTKVFLDDPGTLLVLIVHQTVGWTAVEIDIECSGLLELTVFTSLLLFFSGFDWRTKAVALPAGLLTTFLMNVVRIVIIVSTIHFGGKGAIYVALALAVWLTYSMYVLVEGLFLLSVRRTLSQVYRVSALSWWYLPS